VRENEIVGARSTHATLASLLVVPLDEIVHVRTTHAT
jgi:hypothetical protein